jgi:zinc protease
MVNTASKPEKLGEKSGVFEYKLANGLRVLLAENHSAPVATLLVVYKVGSRNEAVGYTGSTHFLEHMLFKGTREHNAEQGNGLDDLLTQIGAYWNATTWFDRTSYYEVVPKEFFELCVKLEADRMRNLRLRQEDHDSEMSVVRNELERGENHPEEALEKELYAIAFREHPYHHPTIGWRSDVEGVAMDKLRDFYNTYYWPENATVVALGDFNIDETLQIIDNYFGKIPNAPHSIPTVYTVEPPQQGERRFELSRAGDLPRVWVGYHVPSASHKDNFPLAAIRHLLGSTYERSSRLYKRLIDTSIAADVFARHDDLRDPGLFIVGATANIETDLDKLESELIDEIEKLAQDFVDEPELLRIKSSNLKGTILAKADPSSLAFMLGEAESKSDWLWLMNYDENFDAVTKEDILTAAKTYFTKHNRTVGRFIPREGEGYCEEDSDESGQEHDIVEDEPEIDADPATEAASIEEETTIEVPAEGHKALYKTCEIEKFLDIKPAKVTLNFDKFSGSNYADKVNRHVLPNGLTVLTMRSPGSESVAVSFNLKAGRYFTSHLKSSPAELIGDLLPRGSKKYDKLAIAETLEEMGVPSALEVYVDNYRLSLGAHIVDKDLPIYLDLLADTIINPLLTADELEKTKIEWQARFIESKTNTRALAWNKLRQIIYPGDHPFYDKPFDLQLAELALVNREDLVAIHQQLFTPQGAIITLVGDIDEAAVCKLVTERFGDWSGKCQGQPELPLVALPNHCSIDKIFVPEKASLDIVMAHPCSLRRTDADFYAARIANAALGQDTITSRLGQVVRDRAGLTYGIHSSFADTAFGEAPWSVSYSTNPINIERSLQLVNAVLLDYLEHGIAQEDLEKEAGRALGSFVVGLASTSGLARVLTEFEFLGLGTAELDRIATRYQELTKKDVDKAIETYFRPERFVTVISGTI